MFKQTPNRVFWIPAKAGITSPQNIFKRESRIAQTVKLMYIKANGVATALAIWKNARKIKCMDTIEKNQLLEKLYQPYRNSETLLVQGGSNRIIFGEGPVDAKLMFVGEAPGATEDELLRPFVGRSGKLLDATLSRLGSDRSQVFITNIVKVRPPNNRTPSPDEILKGRQLLLKQIEIIQPNVICTLGASALAGVLGNQPAISKLRGTCFPFQAAWLIPTFHPAYILRDQKKLPILVQDIALAIEKSLT